eukprot:9444293-Pyramimonas_sp.AAC.1
MRKRPGGTLQLPARLGESRPGAINEPSPSSHCGPSTQTASPFLPKNSGRGVCLRRKWNRYLHNGYGLQTPFSMPIITVFNNIGFGIRQAQG